MLAIGLLALEVLRPAGIPVRALRGSTIRHDRLRECALFAAPRLLPWGRATSRRSALLCWRNSAIHAYSISSASSCSRISWADRAPAQRRSRTGREGKLWKGDERTDRTFWRAAAAAPACTAEDAATVERLVKLKPLREIHAANLPWGGNSKADQRLRRPEDLSGRAGGQGSPVLQ